jgi:CRP-like cAMP-binding protein
LKIKINRLSLDFFKEQKTMRTIEDLLLNHPTLDGMDPDLILKLAKRSSLRTFQPGEYIFRQGENATHLYLIECGKVEIELFSATGGPVVVQTVESGQVLGWSWLIPPYEWCFDARVVEPSEVIELDALYLRELTEKDHQLGYEVLKRFLKVIAERLYAERLQLVNVFAAHS